MEGNHTCGLCCTEQAAICCKCISPPILLCQTCSATHQAKFPRIPHLSLPVAAANRDEQQYLHNSRQLRERRTALFKNIALYESCCEELSATIDLVIDFLNQYREWKVRSLRQEQAEVVATVNAALQEAEECIALGSEPRNKLARAILLLPTEELTVFAYSINVPHVQEIFEHLVTNENTLQSLSAPEPEEAQVPLSDNPASVPAIEPRLMNFLPEQLISVETHQVKIFSLQEKVWKCSPLQPAIAVYEGSRYVWVQGALFCSGGSRHTGYGRDGKCRREALLLRGGEVWKVQTVADLRVPRFAHALWWLASSRYILVFGGNSHTGTSNFHSADCTSHAASRTFYAGCNWHLDLKECEQLKLPSESWWASLWQPNWLEMSQMRDARSGFNPCEFHNFIYLCGAGSDCIEAFDPIESRFLLVQVRLPEEYSRCLLYTQNEELVVMSEKYVTRYRAEEGHQLEKTEVKRHQSWSVLGNMAPVVRESLLYVVLVGKCYEISEEERREIG